MTTDDKNGVFPRLFVTVSWKTERTDTLDAKFADYRQRLRQIDADSSEATSDNDETDVGLPALPTSDDPRLAVLIVRMEDSAYNWSLFLGDPPTDEDDGTAAILSKAAAIAGGADAIRELAASNWKTTPSVDHRIHFHVPGEGWNCRTLPTRIGEECEDAPALAIGAEASVAEIGYRFASGANGISSVHIAHGEKRDTYHVDVEARGLLRLGKSSWLPFADDVREVVLGALFERKQTDAS
ncbi:MAG TPA: hypothetical protein VHW01_01685 [Polyangiaceae bacterium]|jgi:hypothetical protein|nr:hypothetical protein [Polyangiaceae bacterium]